MRILLSTLLIAALSACYSERPLRKEPPRNNDTYTVEYLFEHDGCKVYRFRDHGNYVYFTNCTGSTFARQDSVATQNTIRRKD